MCMWSTPARTAAASFDLKGFQTRYSVLSTDPGSAPSVCTLTRFSPYTLSPAANATRVVHWPDSSYDSCVFVIRACLRDSRSAQCRVNAAVQDLCICSAIPCAAEPSQSSDYMEHRAHSTPGTMFLVTRASSLPRAMKTPACLCASMMTLEPPAIPPLPPLPPRPPRPPLF